MLLVCEQILLIIFGSWNSLEFTGNHRKSQEIQGNQCKSQEITGNHRKSVEFQEITGNQWNSRKSHEISGIPGNHRKSQELLDYRISQEKMECWKFTQQWPIWQNGRMNGRMA